MFPEHESYEDFRDGNFHFVGGATALMPHHDDRSGPPQAASHHRANSTFVLPRKQLTMNLIRRFGAADSYLRMPPSRVRRDVPDRRSTRLNSSHLGISYAVFCLKKKNN